MESHIREDMEKEWERCSSAIIRTAEEVLGTAGGEAHTATDAKNMAHQAMVNRRTRRTTEKYKRKRIVEKRRHHKMKRQQKHAELVEMEKFRTDRDDRSFYPVANRSCKPFKQTSLYL